MSEEKVTLADIAEELGVSKATVSRAIPGKGRIGKETVQKGNTLRSSRRRRI